MKLLFIRHGDPNYELDCLTERGKIEASYCAKFLKDKKIDFVYRSPMGRAKETCEFYLNETGKTAIEKKWLQEFSFKVYHEEMGRDHCVWNFLPDYWSSDENSLDLHRWQYFDGYKHNPEIYENYKAVCQSFDELLQSHGYSRYNHYYKAISPNHDVLAFFCHFGIESVLLSHIMNVSPVILWHTMGCLPTSITTLVSEERRAGNADFRIVQYGSIEHLHDCDLPQSHQGLFAECFTDEDQLHY